MLVKLKQLLLFAERKSSLQSLLLLRYFPMLLKAFLAFLVLTFPMVGLPNNEEAVVSLSYKGNWFCTAVAIAPHLVLTATHCLDIASQRNIAVEYDGYSCPADREMVRDGNDHSIVHTCREWETYVSFSQARKLLPGDYVVQYGHPNGLPMMYREGYYMGEAPISFSWATMDDTGWLYDVTGWKGDSGGPIFHKGELVGTVSAGYSPDDRFHVMVSYPYTFTEKQLKELGL